MDKNYVVVRSHGKTYLGEQVPVSNGDGVTLKNVVEVLTMIMPVPNGFQKRTTIVGLDYCETATKEVRVQSVSLAYNADDMQPKEVEALKRDYEAFLNKDNLVKTPPQAKLVTP